MRHYRILEKKGGEQKQYIIQYTKKIFFGLFYWKKLNKTVYNRYEDAFNIIKEIIKQEDYETQELTFHYIDAYKIFKLRDTRNSKSTFVPSEVPIIPEMATIVSPAEAALLAARLEKKRLANVSDKRTNKSVFIPKS